MKSLRAVLILAILLLNVTTLFAQAPQSRIYKFAGSTYSVSIPDNFLVWTKDQNSLEELIKMLGLEPFYLNVADCQQFKLSGIQTHCRAVKSLKKDYFGSLELLAYNYQNYSALIKINVLQDPSSIVDPLPPEGAYSICSKPDSKSACLLHLQDFNNNIVLVTFVTQIDYIDYLKTIAESVIKNPVNNYIPV